MPTTRRLCLLAVLVALATAPACADEDPPKQLEATISGAMIQVDDGAPDGFAQFDVTVGLDAQGEFSEIRLTSASAVTLPEGDGSLRFDFPARLMGPQGDADVLSATSGETVVARVVDSQTTNAQLVGWCRLVAKIELEFEGDGLEASAETEVAVGCP